MILPVLVAAVAVVAPILAAFYRPGAGFPTPEITIFFGAAVAATLFPAVENGSWLLLLVQAPAGLGSAYVAVKVKKRAADTADRKK